MKYILHGNIIWTALLILFPYFFGSAIAQDLTANVPDSVVQITTILPGMTNPQTLWVSVKDGIAILEGDIVLGSIAELQDAQDRGVVISSTSYRWPDGKIPYLFDVGFTLDYVLLMLSAIDYINGSTHLLLVPRTTETAYALFTPATVCQSSVGRVSSSSMQTISLMDPYATGSGGAGCYFPQIIHEIAHAAGLYHEQSREDRDDYVTIHLDNVEPGKEHNFDQHISDGTDIGEYDFDSRMHYHSTAFSVDGIKETITANGGETFGVATEYSVGDVATINWMYPDNNCPASFSLIWTIPEVDRQMVFEASNTISSSATILDGNNITYDAEDGVTLTTGFHAEEGSTFHVVIEGCGGIYKRGSDPDVETWLTKALKGKIEQQEDAAQAAQTAITDLNILPNPFSGSTSFIYTLLANQNVSIEVLNATGVLVATPLPRQSQEAGEYLFTFESNNLPAGIYLVVLEKDGERISKRMVLAQ